MFATETQRDERRRNLHASVQTVSAVQTHSDRLFPGCLYKAFTKASINWKRNQKYFVSVCIFVCIICCWRRAPCSALDCRCPSSLSRQVSPQKCSSWKHLSVWGAFQKTLYFFATKAAWKVHEKAIEGFGLSKFYTGVEVEVTQHC